MFGSGVVDTAIGLVFVFLLVSMLVTIVNEMVAAALLSRAKWLRTGIDRLLGSALARQLYDHPLIDGSSFNASGTVSNWAGFRGTGPSYIPSRSFANVLLDLVHQGDSTLDDAKKGLQEALDAVTSLDNLREKILGAASKVRPSAQSLGTLSDDLARLMDRLTGVKVDLVPWASGLADAASKLTDPSLASLKDALLHLVGQAQIQTADAGAANWAPSSGEAGQTPPVTATATAPSVEELRIGLQTAIASVPYIAMADAIKKDLGGILDRLQAGYTVGDAKADVQRFIDAMPARYLREVIKRLPDPKTSKTLLVLLDDAEHDVDQFKQNVEVWFNNAMDRVGGWYKRRSQWVIAGLSIGAAVLMNVDAIQVVKYLDTHPGVRDALVTQAKAYADSNATGAKYVAESAKGEKSKVATGAPDGSLVAESGGRFEGVLHFAKAASVAGTITLSSSAKSVTLPKPTVEVPKEATQVTFVLDSEPATTTSTVTITAAGAAQGSATVRIDPSLVAKLDDVRDRLTNLNLPIGWVTDTPSQAEITNKQVFTSSTLCGAIKFHLLGWILTALAASLGAPFWFDTLNRFISIRSAGKAPEESPKPPKTVPLPLEPGQPPREADPLAAVRRP